MGIEPKIISESEPISEINKINQPVGQKNATGDQVNPATEDTLSAQLNITLSALRDAICAAGVDTKTLNDLYGYLARYGQLPSDLTVAGNLKLSIQESAITVPFDLQAQSYSLLVLSDNLGDVLLSLLALSSSC